MAAGDSLRDKQISSLRKVLSLNEDPTADVLKNGLPWKVLVYDVWRPVATFLRPGLYHGFVQEHNINLGE